MSDLIAQSCASLIDAMRSGDLSSTEVVAAFLARAEQVNPSLNAIVVPRFAEARREAEAADKAIWRGDPVGVLHGLPLTIKECFHLKGTPSTMGLTNRSAAQSADGILVQRLRTAGGIVIGKTNVPQLMLWHEADNPRYGRTNNPHDLKRSPGGSTGGEAAIIAAGGSPLGLGGDLGGSIRLPAHFCGIHGIKPTSHRLPRIGTSRNLRGMEAMVYQPGPLARHVEDLVLALNVLVGGDPPTNQLDVVPPQRIALREAGIDGLRGAMWVDDGYFAAAPALGRAVRETAAALQRKGAIIREQRPPDIAAAMRLYYRLLGSDGAADARQLVKGSRRDRRLRKLLRVARIPRAARWMLAGLLRRLGQSYVTDLLTSARPLSAREYWQTTHELMQWIARWEDWFADLDFILTPPHALPAMLHGKALDLIPAASYSFLANITGVPAGVVSMTRVRSDEESDRDASRDRVVRQAERCEADSAGLPVAVQVMGKAWREDIVLTVMKAIQDAFCQADDYPARPVSPK